MLQSKKCTHTSIKKYNNKSLSFCCSHYQTLFIHTISNADKLTNSSESVLKTKSVRAKSVKNVTDIVSNIVNILASLKWNSETEQDKNEYCAQEM